MTQEDNDIKIAPERLSDVFDSSEGAANAFLRETQNGNMQKAKVLGRQFAAELTILHGGASLFGVGAFDTEETLLQRRVLFAYLAISVIEDLSPNSMVAQSAISSFYDTIQAELPELYDTLVSPAVYSQYVLAARGLSIDPQGMGKVFSRLCQKDGDVLFIRYGCELADYFSMYCTQLVLKIQMVR